jgi:hypothetical protein
MERLAVLIVESVEEVDDEHQRRERVARLLAGLPLNDGSSVETIAPAEKGGSALAGNCQQTDQDNVYIVLIRNPGGSSQVFERPLVRCYSHEEASRLRRELRHLGYESVTRLVGLGTAAD